MAKVDYIYAKVVDYHSTLLAWPSVQTNVSDDPWVDELAMAAGSDGKSLEQATPSPVNRFTGDLDAKDLEQVSLTLSANQFAWNPCAPEFVRVDANDELYRATPKTADKDLPTPDVNDELYKATPEPVDKNLSNSCPNLRPDLEHRCGSSELLLSRLLTVWKTTGTPEVPPASAESGTGASPSSLRSPLPPAAIPCPDVNASGGGDDWLGAGLGWAGKLVAEKRQRDILSFPGVEKDVEKDYQRRIARLLTVLRGDEKRQQILLRDLETDFRCRGGGEERLLRELELYEEFAEEDFDVLCDNLDDAGNTLDYKLSLQ
jgi:hypothetical protein